MKEGGSLRITFWKRGGDSGSTLAMIALFTAVTLISIVSLFSISGQDASLAFSNIRSSQAFYLAEAGLRRAEAWFEAQDAQPEQASEFNPFGDNPDTLGGGTYFVSVVPDSGESAGAKRIYTIVSRGAVRNKARTLELDIAHRSWADYLYFTDREHTPGSGGPCWFVTGDHLDGPVHTNDQIHILGDPVFGGVVTSSHDGLMFEYYNGDPLNHVESSAPANPPHDNPTFEEGYMLDADPLELPHQLSDFKDAAEDAGVSIAGQYEIVLGRLNGGGEPMYGYVSYLKGQKWTDILISDFNGMMYVNGGASVSGTLDGQLTIATSGKLTIADGILYRASDESGPLPGCDDVLGLVSGSDIVVENNAANQDDCVIHAHMIALNTSFRAESWGSGDPRGTLTVHGGICQVYRGTVGRSQLVGTEVLILSGYAKDYHYDQRLLSMAPPGYRFVSMGGDRYIRLDWREVVSH